MVEKELKHVVRIVNTDLKGDRPLEGALTQIKGVGFAFAKSICVTTKIDKNKKVGYLTEDDVSKINAVLKEPLKFGIPVWQLNRKKDYETGSDLHMVGVDLTLKKQDDIKRLQNIRSYRGMRLAWGQPVRGQRTRSNFRANKGKVVGVKRRKGAKAGRV
ncbi:MAG: 30S ribosomal protein S13 [Candidatus Woesearchaeota archaeon]